MKKTLRELFESSKNYSFKWDRIGDVTLITLKEKKLGKLNKLGFEYY